MSKIMIRRYEGTIYPEGNGYTGAIDLGYNAMGRRRRIKRRAGPRRRLRTSSSRRLTI